MTHFLTLYWTMFSTTFSSSFSWLFAPQSDPPFTVKNPWKSPLENPIQNCDSEGIFLGVEFHEKPPSDRGSHRQNPPFPFLYINPYDTGSIFFFFEKCALFSIPFHENFSIGRNFGLNPVSKKLWLGGESYKWAKKGLHRALFIGISHLHTRDGSWIGQIFRPVGSVFLTFHAIFLITSAYPPGDPLPRPEMTPEIMKKSLHRANKSI